MHIYTSIAPQAMITSTGAMNELMDFSFEMERQQKVLNVTVAGGFPFSDIPDAGMSFVVTTDGDLTLADNLAQQLQRKAYESRARFAVDEVSVEEAIRISGESEDGPDIFIEGSDNVGGGSPADATHVLKHLPDLPLKSLIVNCDPDAVRQAHQLGVGHTLETLVGGKTDRLHGEPVKLKGQIRLLFDGKYRHIGAYMTGHWADMGKTAVVEAGTCTVILTEFRSAPWDLGHVASVGIDPKAYKIIVVKSAVAWKTAFGSYAKKEIYIDTPGCCGANLRYFNYQKLRRLIYPLDE